MLDRILRGCQVGYLAAFKVLKVTSCFGVLLVRGADKDADRDRDRDRKSLAYEVSQEAVTAFSV